MTRHINDHVPMGASVAISGEDIRRIEGAILDALEPVREIANALAAKDGEQPAPVAVLSAEQFDELKALLQPGFELSKLMLADYTAQRAAALIAAPGEKDPPLMQENLQENLQS